MQNDESQWRRIASTVVGPIGRTRYRLEVEIDKGPAREVTRMATDEEVQSFARELAQAISNDLSVRQMRAVVAELGGILAAEEEQLERARAKCVGLIPAFKRASYTTA